ncbi:MAG: polyprenyl synthetase family protein [Spirochaetales bacterium]|nr:polyprenyl synthetase family protein [Spirochaetales bacterium]
MLGFLMQHKAQISAYLKNYLALHSNRLARINSLGPKVLEELLEFTTRGKMIRGSLVFLGGELCGSDAYTQDIIAVGASLELLQSALLIHDDIMDRDDERRGAKSIHALYDDELEQRRIPDHRHIAESLAICAGDISFFQGFEILAALSADTDIRLKLFSLFSAEMGVVGTAQMLDIAHTADLSFPEKDAILDLYRYKTGRYTFALPLLAGGILSRASDTQLSLLEEIGELMGIIFQIRDDELGLFGDPEKTGKPAGSDIYEGKKTLHMYELRTSLNQVETQFVDLVLNSETVTPVQYESIMTLMDTHKIRSIMQDIIASYQDQVSMLIQDFPSPSQGGKDSLREILSFIASREK